MRRLLLLLLLWPAITFASTIELFSSYITVAPDASLTVKEDITVDVNGNDIQRGIYRVFPQTNTGFLGLKQQTHFKVQKVLLDGNSVPYFSKNTNEGTKVYIGDKNKRVSPGQYTYTLIYTTTNQLRYFTDYDELYWNVTGNQWAFPIKQAQATVELPFGAKVIQQSAYTGRYGASDKDYRVEELSPTRLVFTTTKVLNQKQGFTVAVAFPKGIVYEPSTTESFNQYVHDNIGAIIASLLCLFLIAYYLTVWNSLGRDPKKGTIYPQFVPPPNISPAAMRYISQMGYDDKTFSTAVVSLAAKGYLQINENDGVYSLVKQPQATKEALSPGELSLVENLFASGDRVDIKKTDRDQIIKGTDALKKKLKSEFNKIYFVTNQQYLIIGLLFSIVAIIALGANAQDYQASLFLLIWLSGWSLGVIFLLKQAWSTWRVTLKKSSQRISGVLKSLSLSIFAAPFLVAELVVLGILLNMLGLLSIVIFFIIIGTNVAFHYLLKAHTIKGRRLMDDVEGFKLYLSKAEKYRLEKFNAPAKTIDVFEAYLPYAVALDVEEKWSTYFNDVIVDAMQSPDSSRTHYSPTWYHATANAGVTTTDILSGIGAGLAASVASASISPSSGSGGGGFSGGGGGGGGGGGW